MKKPNPGRAAGLFFLLGYAILAVSLLAGCGWSVEGENFRINAPPEDSEDGTPGF